MAMNLKQNKKQTYSIKDTSNARDVVLFVLLNVTEEKKKSHVQLRETLDACKALSPKDRAFVTRTVTGTLDRLIYLDHLIGRYSRTPLPILKPVIRAILRMSVYQLFFMDKVPPSAVCNEAVKLAKLHGFSGLSGYVNGVLRAMLRGRESGAETFTREPEAHIRLSVPKWLYKKLSADFGKERAEEICKAYLMERALTVRFNLSKAGEEEICALLAEDGAEYRRLDMRKMLADAERVCAGELDAENAQKHSGKRSRGEAAEGGSRSEAEKEGPAQTPEADLPEEALPVMYELTNVNGIAGLRAFRAGFLQVQDASAALAAALSGVKAGECVIDVCAAPGGKTLQFADLLCGSGSVEARDISPQKTALIEENVKRAGFQNVRVRVWDALSPDEESYCRADVVMADLPCSGLGIAARKPDIKYNLKPYSIRELRDLQRDMLSVVSKYVKRRGKLVYSTCTLTPEEDEENVRWAVQNLGLRLRCAVKLFPNREHDGFFIAVLERC